MKSYKAVLAILLMSLPLTAELSVKNIEKMVQDIRSEREGKIKDHTIPSSPFVMVEKDENSSTAVIEPVQEQKEEFKLGAIVNSAAFIDGQWYKKGTKLNDFMVDEVVSDHVILKRKNRTITLFFKKGKNLIKVGKE